MMASALQGTASERAVCHMARQFPPRTAALKLPCSQHCAWPAAVCPSPQAGPRREGPRSEAQPQLRRRRWAWCALYDPGRRLPERCVCARFDVRPFQRRQISQLAAVAAAAAAAAHGSWRNLSAGAAGRHPPRMN